MANRNWSPLAGALYKGLVYIPGKINLHTDASVLVPTSSGQIPGVTSVTKTSTGLYKITLQDKFYALVDWSIQLSEATLTALRAQLKEDAILLGSSNSPNSVSFWTASGNTATDVTAATSIYFGLWFRNSNL